MHDSSEKENSKEAIKDKMETGEKEKWEHTVGLLLCMIGTIILIVAVIRVCLGLMPYTVISSHGFYIDPGKEYTDGFAVPENKEVEISVAANRPIDLYVYTAKDYYYGKHTPVLVLKDILGCSEGFTNRYHLEAYQIVLKNHGWESVYIEYLRVSFKDSSEKLFIYGFGGIFISSVMIGGGITLMIHGKKREKEAFSKS